MIRGVVLEEVRLGERAVQRPSCCVRGVGLQVATRCKWRSGGWCQRRSSWSLRGGGVRSRPDSRVDPGDDPGERVVCRRCCLTLQILLLAEQGAVTAAD